jgi:hypothetical protein
VDVSRGEAVEHELNRLIEKRHDQGATEEQEKLEDLWMPSVQTYAARREEELRDAWREHFLRMRAVHWSIGDEYDAKLQALENGPREEPNRHHRG